MHESLSLSGKSRWSWAVLGEQKTHSGTFPGSEAPDEVSLLVCRNTWEMSTLVLETSCSLWLVPSWHSLRMLFTEVCFQRSLKIASHLLEYAQVHTWASSFTWVIPDFLLRRGHLRTSRCWRTVGPSDENRSNPIAATSPSLPPGPHSAKQTSGLAFCRDKGLGRLVHPALCQCVTAARGNTLGHWTERTWGGFPECGEKRCP